MADAAGAWGVADKEAFFEIVAREVADFNREKAKAITTRLLKQGLAVDAIFAHNDEMILGVIEAFEAAQRPLPAVLVGFDATAEAVQAVKHKQLTATIAQQPEDMGWHAIQTAVQVFKGEQLPSVIFVDLELIETP